MYSYDIGYNTCEHSPDLVLLHEKKFTEDELRDICVQALVTAWKAFHDTNGDPSEGESSSISFWFENYYGKMVEEMVLNHGFMHIEITGRFKPFGWGNMLIPKSWEEYAGTNKDNIAIWDAFKKIDK